MIRQRELIHFFVGPFESGGFSSGFGEYLFFSFISITAAKIYVFLKRSLNFLPGNKKLSYLTAGPLELKALVFSVYKPIGGFRSVAQYLSRKVAYLTIYNCKNG